MQMGQDCGWFCVVTLCVYVRERERERERERDKETDRYT